MKAPKVSLFKVLIILLLIVTGLWSLTSCQDIKKPSFIIVAADQLSFNSFSCNEDRATGISGLNTLCQESIRFTNAFTTSTQTAAAMGSLLSGAYPYQHRLHRSFDRINPEQPLLQEFFKSANYRTSFWSGNPAILKKTGLSRGFDVFDDSSFLNQSMYSMNFKEQTILFRNWANESALPFFSVIYTSELESLNEGETQISSIENFDDKLGLFFNELKAANLWESNYVVVLGLQGKSEYNRPNESAFSNLHSENTNVALFVKPPRQKGDEGINWKIDGAVNLADLGYSLIKTINPLYTLIKDLRFPVWEFSGLWMKNENLSADSRKLIVSSTCCLGSRCSRVARIAASRTACRARLKPKNGRRSPRCTIDDGIRLLESVDSMLSTVNSNQRQQSFSTKPLITAAGSTGGSSVNLPIAADAIISILSTT